jgi:hypothetical protein
MRQGQGWRRLGGALLLGAALAGCGKRGANGAEGGAVTVDTANPSQLDGVSDTELQREAKALTPEQAAAQGMVDSTTHIENLGDSAAQTAPAAAAPVSDSAPRRP